MVHAAAFADDPATALRGYAAAGLHVEDNLFDGAYCDRLIEEAGRFPEVLKGDFRTALQPHRQSPLFLEALRHPGIARIMRQILGGEISGIQTQFFYCKPGTPGFQAHQDNRFVNAPQGAFASAWVALVDVTADNGALIVYPG